MDVFKVLKKDSLCIFTDMITKNDNLLNEKDRFGNSLLLMATFMKSNKIAKYLISRNILIDSKDTEGYNVLRKAILINNIEIINYLAEKNAIDTESEDTRQAILLAVKLKLFETCKTLFDVCDIQDNHKWYSDIELTKPTDDIRALIKISLKNVLEPIEMYPRDDLCDLYTMDDILPGVEYSIRKDNEKYYCMGTRKTVETLHSTKYKTTNLSNVFDLVQNKAVTFASVSFCIKNKCPDVVKKIYNGTFAEQDIVENFKDEIYNCSLYDFATHYGNKKAMEILNPKD